jgi:hypothetical protein
MRSRIGLFAATTVLTACGLLLTGCGPEEDSSADSPSSSAGSSQGESGKSDGKEKESAGGSNEGSTSGPSDGSNQKPDAPACTEEDTTVTLKGVSGSGKATIEMVNDTGTVCSVYGAPNLVLKAEDETDLISPPAVDKSKKPAVVTLDSKGSVATANLKYESAPPSEGGSQDGITCGDEAASAVVATDDSSWQTEIKVTGSGDSGMIVCGKKATITPFRS